ncbi:MAG: protein phosphatase 2C domain-containing protein [Muribaculaceae bacterium]|nr:protein phosphatase 2C domain-containing protein [Muribaculaceae bacterium]
MRAISFSCQGESHIASGKVCQDYSYSHVYENGNAIAIVCDGHGGKRYFRSDVGAKIAAKVAEVKVNGFIDQIGESLIKGTPFTQRGTISEQIAKGDFSKSNKIDSAFRWLFGSIISEWNSLVTAHAECNPITETEKTSLEERWVTDFEGKVNFEKVYGCTLMVYVYTPEYWFAFQIGDGKCFACNDKGNWTEPIPWDDNCFLNKTTSISDSGAIDEFRYCYEGDGVHPIAVILGSDGIDDSFGLPENQANFYVQILKSIVTSGEEATIKEIESDLPQLSKIGSQDDMSLSMIYDEEKLKEIYLKLIEWQISNVKRDIANEYCKIGKANKIQQSLESIERPTRQNLIDLQYANADEKKAIEIGGKLMVRLEVLMKELNKFDRGFPLFGFIILKFMVIFLLY